MSIFIRYQHKVRMSSNDVEVYNRHRDRLNAATEAITQSFMHLIKPDEQFPYYTNQQIMVAWLTWMDEFEVFHAITSADPGPEHFFPEPPAEDQKHIPCRRMWGLLIQRQIEGEYRQASSLKRVVEEILASEDCRRHPLTCACKLSENPWTHPDCLKALDPLIHPKVDPIREQYLDHQMAQHYRELNLIRKRRICSCSETPCQCFLPNQNTYDYSHKVETCACGTCHKARADSGY